MTYRRRSLRSLWTLLVLGCAVVLLAGGAANAQDTRLLRQPTLSQDHVAFAHGGDLWVVDRSGGDARRLTSTPAVESDPHFSPDGRTIAFTSNRSGRAAVYVLPVAGGMPTRLTWYPAPSAARGWTPDGERVLYASTRETAPVGFNRLWTVSPAGGPSTLLPAPWGYDGSYSPDGKRIAVDRVSRWDVEWRHYRGGQNTPLTILDLDDLSEIRLPNERTTDVHPVWIDSTVYFLSDRDWTMNVWSYDPASGNLSQVTEFEETDVKWLSGQDGTLIFERDGYLHTLDPSNGQTRKVEIAVQGDFPWAEPRWSMTAARHPAPSPHRPPSASQPRRASHWPPPHRAPPRWTRQAPMTPRCTGRWQRGALRRAPRPGPGGRCTVQTRGGPGSRSRGGRAEH